MCVCVYSVVGCLLKFKASSKSAKMKRKMFWKAEGYDPPRQKNNLSEFPSNTFQITQHKHVYQNYLQNSF